MTKVMALLAVSMMMTAPALSQHHGGDHAVGGRSRR
jgi:hypothetical protein